MINLERKGDVFTMTLDSGENRWNTSFVRELSGILDEVVNSLVPLLSLLPRPAKSFFQTD